MPSYVPPHLRGRGSGNSTSTSSNSTSNRTSTSTSTSTSNSNSTSNSTSNPSSRWKNLDKSNSYNSSNSSYSNTSNTNGYNRYGGRNSSHNSSSYSGKEITPTPPTNHSSASTAGRSTGRWANVDRSAIAAGGSSSRYNNNNNNSNANSNSNSSSNNDNRSKGNRRFQDNNGNTSDNIRAIFFGDSFIKLFGLLNEYTDSVLHTPRTIEVQKYKAASAKGLLREGNENRAKIRRTMDNIINHTHTHTHTHTHSNHNKYQNLERLVFCFGSVDVHMSYYYKKYVQQQPLSNDDLTAIATNYVDFVAGLETLTKSQTQPKKLIVGIYPSPLCDKDVGASLMAYGSLETKEQVRSVDTDSDHDTSIESRQARVDLFNKALRERCEFHNKSNDNGIDNDSSNNGILEYWDVRDELLTLDETTGRPKVKDVYRDVSDLNIHLIHETVLQLWVQKWPWYEALTTNNTNSNIKSNIMSSSKSNTNSNTNRSKPVASFLEYLQETFDEYRKTKPWAERTHVAETRGIRLA